MALEFKILSVLPPVGISRNFSLFFKIFFYFKESSSKLA